MFYNRICVRKTLPGAAAFCAALGLFVWAQPCVRAIQNENPSHVRLAPTAAPFTEDAPSQADNVPDPGSSPVRTLTRGQRLARTALGYRGIRYRWGGRSEKTGFDCSGLVQAVYARWGILLPRVARAQYKIGVPVKQQDLRAGDLVFFKNTYRRGLSHVGIYLGEGFFIHAAGQRKGVMLSRLDSDYHKKHWAGARRVDHSKLPHVEGEEMPDAVFLEEALADAKQKP